MIVRALADRVLIRPETQEYMTKTGLWIPEQAEGFEKHIGEILAIGPEKVEFGVTVPMPGIKVGDLVFYSKYGGAEIKVQDEVLVLLYYKDIMAVLIKEEEDEE